MSKVPLGVIFLAVLNILAGILILVGDNPLFHDYSIFILSSILRSIPYGPIIMGLIYIVLGFGLFSLAKWAWYIDIAFALLNLLIIILDVFTTGGPLHIGSILWIPLLINLIIVLYLNQGTIRRKFEV